jgi:CHAT domain-containing protein/tetratricopeptide (TPR) repeat protein
MTLVRLYLCLAAVSGLAPGCGTSTKPQAVHEQIELSISRGDLDAARTDVDQALTRFGTTNVEWLWRFRILKARILASQSDSSSALAVLAGDLPAPLANTDIAVQKSMLEGAAYRIAQDFDRSNRAFAAAVQLATSSYQRLLPKVLIARAALEVDEKNYSAAEESYHRALLLAREQNDREQEAAAMVNLARLAMSQERFDAAIDQNQVALRLSRSLGIQTFVATALGNMGWGYFELGDFENALDYFKQGAEASSKTGLKGYSAYWFTGVATSYLALHEYGQAEDLAQSTLEHAHQLKNAQTTTICLNTLTEIMLHAGRLTEAERYNEEAMGIEASGSDKFGRLDSLLMAGHIAEAQRRFPEAENFFQQVLADPTAESPRIWDAEAGLAGVRDDEGKPLDADHLYRQAIETIEKARQSVNHDELRMSFLSGGIAVYGEYVDFLIRRGKLNDALKVAEFSRARTLEEGLTVEVKKPSETERQTLPQEIARKSKATLMFYWIGEKNSYLWIITPGKTDTFKLARAAEIEPLVKSYRKAILGMHDAQDAAAADGKKLYAMLVEPAKKLIPKGSRVILLPAESLYGLNFETLVVSDPQPHFWIEDVTLTTASSLTLLNASIKRPSIAGKDLLLVGNTEPNASFPALAQAPVEIQKIEHYFPELNRKVLEGKSATPTAYLNSSPEKFAYLHFVTHGTASITRPLESAVILSSEGDSYKLYARDIVKHRLNAHLVTISACDGLGKRTYSGEGLVGLSWAFLRAGAHNVIGALWEVSDASTPQLMDELYNGLSEGKDPATALRDAKLFLLHSDTIFKKPFYWAPFQLYAGS